MRLCVHSKVRTRLALSLAVGLMGSARVNAITIRSGEALRGSISVPGESDEYQFEAQQGDHVFVRMASENLGFQPKIEIRGPDGAVRASADGRRVAETATVVSEGGAWRIMCQEEGVEKGKYVLSFVNVSQSRLSGTDKDLGQLTGGKTVQGDIGLPGDLDVAFFEGNAGDTVLLQMTSADLGFRPSIQLVSPDGKVLHTAVESRIAKLEMKLPAQGRYAVVCKEGSGNGGVNDGPYSLYFRKFGRAASSSPEEEEPQTIAKSTGDSSPIKSGESEPKQTKPVPQASTPTAGEQMWPSADAGHQTGAPPDSSPEPQASGPEDSDGYYLEPVGGREQPENITSDAGGFPWVGIILGALLLALLGAGGWYFGRKFIGSR